MIEMLSLLVQYKNNKKFFGRNRNDEEKDIKTIYS
jgi:hypothetical protein